MWLHAWNRLEKVSLTGVIAKLNRFIKRCDALDQHVLSVEIEFC